MNKLLKRIVAGVCTVTMLTGICVIKDSMLANAEAELPQKEWSVITEAEQWRTDSSKELNSCDVQIDDTECTIETENVKVGTGAAKLETSANNRYQYTVGNMDLSNYANGMLHMWFYVDNVNNLPKNNIQIILSSGGNSNLGVNSDLVAWWNVPTSKLTNSGWAEIFVDLTSPDYKGASFVWTKVNKMKVQLGTSASTEVTTIIDDIYVTRERQDIVLHNCDDNTGMQITNEIDIDVKKEGNGALKLTGTAGNRYQRKFPSSLNLSGYANGTLRLWFYISDVTELTNPNLSLTFGTNDLNNHYTYYYPKSVLVNEWNELVIDLANPNATGGTFEWTNVTHFRVHLSSNASADITTLVDDIRIIPNNELRQQASLRFSTTVDSLKYKEVGFKIKIGDEDWKDAPSNTVYKQIYAQGSSEVLTYSPKVFAAQSKYFNSYEIWDIREANFDTDIKVQAYWITQDGTTVVSDAVKEFTINDAIALVGN